MGETGGDLDIDFVISTGDNFYDDGIISPYDSQFQDSFTNIYTAPSLQKPWYNGKYNNLSCSKHNSITLSLFNY